MFELTSILNFLQNYLFNTNIINSILYLLLFILFFFPIIFLHNMLHVLIWIIVLFIFFSIYLIFLGSLYISMVFFIVYISGISLLFLFIIMSYELNRNKIDYAFTLLSVSLILLTIIFFSLIFSSIDYTHLDQSEIILTYQYKNHLFDIFKIGTLVFSTKYVNTFFFFTIFLLISVLITINLTNYRKNNIITLTQKLQNFKLNKYNHLYIYNIKNEK